MRLAFLFCSLVFSPAIYCPVAGAVPAGNPNLIAAEAIGLATGLLHQRGVTVSSLGFAGKNRDEMLLVVKFPGDPGEYACLFLTQGHDAPSLASHFVALVEQIRLEHPPDDGIIALGPLLLRCRTHTDEGLYDSSEG